MQRYGLMYIKKSTLLPETDTFNTIMLGKGKNNP